MLKEKRQEVKDLYRSLGIENVEAVHKGLATGRLNGHFSTKATISRGKLADDRTGETMCRPKD